MKPFNLLLSFPSRVLMRVTILTLVVCLTRCAYVQHHYAEPCNSRAYVGLDLIQFITQRFHSKAPVRIGVVPYSTPANLAPSKGTEVPGIGTELAWSIHQRLLSAEDLPVVEVLNRQDWPGKKDEFFTGNFGAISIARDAGFDLVLVGYIEPQKKLDSMTAYTKLIEVESGITVYYGKNTVVTNRPEFYSTLDAVWLTKRDPSELYFNEMSESLSRCIVRGLRNAEQ